MRAFCSATYVQAISNPSDDDGIRVSVFDLPSHARSRDFRAIDPASGKFDTVLLYDASKPIAQFERQWFLPELHVAERLLRYTRSIRQFALAPTEQCAGTSDEIGC